MNLKAAYLMALEDSTMMAYGFNSYVCDLSLSLESAQPRSHVRLLSQYSQIHDRQ